MTAAVRDAANAVGAAELAQARTRDADVETRQRCRLEPPWAGVGRSRGGGQERVHWPLVPHSFRLLDIDAAPGEGPVSPTVARDEYAQLLWPKLEAALTRLGHDQGSSELADDAVFARRCGALVDATTGLLESTLSRAPAWPGASLVDVSLSTWARVHAAVAVALYVEHEAGATPSDAPLALVSCELVGGGPLFATLDADASPMDIAGRAAWLALLAQALGDGLLDTLALPSVSRLVAAGTRFEVILPARLADAARAFLADSESRLVDLDVGGLSISHGLQPLSLATLTGAPWTHARRALQDARALSAVRPHADLLGRAHGHGALFTPQAPHADVARKAHHAQLAHLGSAIVRARAFARVPAGDEGHIERALRAARAKTCGHLAFAPLNGAYVFVEEAQPEPLDLGPQVSFVATMPDARVPMARLQTGFAPLSRGDGAGGGSHNGQSVGEQAPCARLAQGARGRPAFGALVARVPHVEERVAAGFEEGQCSLLRAVELARSAEQFAMGYAGSVAMGDDRAQVVRVDADSVTVMAAWDRLLPLALALRDTFRRYAGGNAEAGLSVGVAVAAPGEAIGAVLERAEAGAARAVRVGHGDALHLYGMDLSWLDASFVAEWAASLDAMSPEARARICTLLLRLGRTTTLGARARTSRGGGVLRRGRGAWRTMLALEGVSRRAGAARGELQKLLVALRAGLWDGRRTELPIEVVASVAAQWSVDLGAGPRPADAT